MISLSQLPKSGKAHIALFERFCCVEQLYNGTEQYLTLTMGLLSNSEVVHTSFLYLKAYEP